MSWLYDEDPTEYLERRIRYFKTKMSKVKNLIKSQTTIEKYGEEELRSMIARRLLALESYIVVYKNAVKYLEIIENDKVILQPHWDKNGYLDGGIIVEEGVVKGHIDPRGEPGPSGFIGKINKD